MKEYTKRYNLNRGFMKLEVWRNSIELFKLSVEITHLISGLDLKLKSRILDSVQSISANIAEGYCRKSISEYLHFLNISLGSSGELFTRVIGLNEMKLITADQFNEFDCKHYEVENKLLALVKSLQDKQKDGTWDNKVHELIRHYSIP
jgi:four helix bundle protein